MYNQLAPIFHRRVVSSSSTTDSIPSTYGIEMGRIDALVPGRAKAYYSAQ